MASSLQRELNRFSREILHTDYDIQTVTKGALSQARAKLIPEAFLELNKTAVTEFYEGASYRVWKTHRLLAIDGSTLNLPSHHSTKEVFGEKGVGCKADVLRSMARISVCYDVLNLITLDGKMEAFDVSEQALMKQHLEVVPFKIGDIVLFDRAYPSIALMYILMQMGVHFCMRMKDNWWKEVDKFSAENGKDKEVIFELPSKDQYLQQQWGGSSRTVKCRLVAVELGNGEKEILCTSLLDTSVYTLADLKELYHYRWNVEEAYKLFKCRVQLEVFSGKTAHAVRQDFYAKLFMMTVCAALSFPIENKVRQQTAHANRKHPHQINRTNALAFCRDGWLTLWLKKQTSKLLRAMDDMLLKTTDIIRPGRKFRRKKANKKPPAMTYKQL